MRIVRSARTSAKIPKKPLSNLGTLALDREGPAMADVEWYQLTARIPLKIEKGNTGIWFITSPLIKGLLVSGQSRKEAMSRIVECVEDLASASTETEKA